MLRMVLLGLLIPLAVGALAAMDFRTPPRTAVTVVQPLVETTVGISDSHGALAKADRLEITYAKSETPTQPILDDERISPSEATTIGSPEAPRIINRHRHDPKQRKSPPLPFLSRSQRLPISSELLFPIVQRPPATPSPAG